MGLKKGTINHFQNRKGKRDQRGAKVSIKKALEKVVIFAWEPRKDHGAGAGG